MSDITIQSAEESDIPDLIALNLENHIENLTLEEANQFGFLILIYSEDLLRRMMQVEPFIVAKAEGKIVGYLYPMPNSYRSIPGVSHRFEDMDRLTFEGRSMREINYIKLGSACIAKDYKGKGVFKMLYDEMKRRYVDAYEIVLTRVFESNGRSLAGHMKLGFIPFAQGSQKCLAESHIKCGGSAMMGKDTELDCKGNWNWLYIKWREQGL
mmetsp:Transcript_18624/g.33663  ORF Transcript_18624/g.33663 Transcript_18624/m.33663 type:complete len:211 (+) Transcript_18624:49-681(+)